MGKCYRCEKQVRICVLVLSFGFVRQLLYARLNDPWSIADKLPDRYQSLLVVVIVVTVMPNDHHVVVVAAVVASMPIWLRKSAGCKEHKQDKYQILLHVRTLTNAHNDCLCNIALYS